MARLSMGELRAKRYEKVANAAVDLPTLREVKDSLKDLDIIQMLVRINELDDLVNAKTSVKRREAIGDRVDLYSEEIEKRLQACGGGKLAVSKIDGSTIIDYGE